MTIACPGGYLIHAADGFCGLVTAFPAAGQGIYHGGSVDFIHRHSRGLTLRTNNALSSSYANVTAGDFLDAKQFSGGSRTLLLGSRFEF